MDAEFDTVAEWTAELALALGPDHHLPAGCRGSGGPGALDWLLDRLAPRPGQTLLDVGAGVGGPAGYAARRAGVRPVLVEPERGACRAARRLFGVPALQADGAALPIAADSVDLLWSLGVLSTVPDQPALLGELRRVARAGARIGLLVYLAREPVRGAPEGNDFPSPAALADLLAAAGLHVTARAALAGMPDAPAGWDEAAARVEAELARRHGAERAWQLAEEQAGQLGRLLGSGAVAGELLVLTVGR